MILQGAPLESENVQNKDEESLNLQIDATERLLAALASSEVESAPDSTFPCARAESRVSNATVESASEFVVYDNVVGEVAPAAEEEVMDLLSSKSPSRSRHGCI